MRRVLTALASAAVALVGFAAAAPVASADGFLVPTQPDRRVRGDWAVTYHRVEVQVRGQQAHVRVEEEFTNLSSVPLETEYVFPAPAGAMVSAVTLMVDGRGMEGRLLRAEEARRIYDDIVRRQKDPALVEYVGRDFFRASIFPIPPHGARQLVLEYDHLLPKDGTSIELLYPLNTEKFSAKPLRDVRVTVDIENPSGIGPVYSPSHDVHVSRRDDKRVVATFEAREIRPETDFLLYWSEARGDVGATLLTHWPRGEDRGYFLLLASPTLPDSTAIAARPKEIQLVVDVSGSMAGEKMEQARAALRQVVGGLNDGDRFNVIAYSTGVVPLWDATKPATRENRDEAMKFVEQLRSSGGTNIAGALRAALASPSPDGMPRTILFLTDGRPTIEVTDADAILKEAAAKNPGGKVRVFSFGVGVDVNSVLLDKLALDNHGAPAYVRPSEDVERKVASLYDKIRYPVLTDVRVEFSGISPSEALPGTLPDLFRGGQIVIAGRYRKGGPVDVVITGRDGEQGREYPYRLSAGAEGQGLRDDFPARVWATRRIADLLDQIRLLGRREKELVDEIVRLSTKFGIMTEYTSFLADETADHGRVRENLARTLSALDELAPQAEGSVGFAQGWNNGQRREADKPAPAPSAPMGGAAGADGRVQPGLLTAKAGDRDVEEQKVSGGLRQVGNRAFYKRATAWVDSEVKDAAKVDETIARWSPRFFEILATTTAEENARLAQEGDVLMLLQGRNVLVTENR